MNNKIFFIILSILISLSIGMTFYRIVILKNYQIVAEVSCDPITEKCFIGECDADECSYYKKISKKANDIAICESTIEKNGCNGELSCTAGETSCSYTFCDPSNISEDEKCSE